MRGRDVSLLALIVPLWLAPAMAPASVRTLALPTLAGEYRITFDRSPLSDEDVMRLIVLSPHLSGWDSNVVVPALEQCALDDPAYRGCGHAPGDAAFLRNAEVNVERGEGKIRRFARLGHPIELEPVVQYVVRSLRLSLWLEETRLEFIRSWDPAVLQRPWGGVDPTVVCRTVIERLAEVETRDARADLARHDWHNCMNQAARHRLGAYPTDAWERFLRAYGIEEEIVEKQPSATP